MYKRIQVTTSWDDGHRLDMKLADLLEAYGLTGTFYVSSENHELTPTDRLSKGAIKDLNSRGFEIGAHTLTHPHLGTLSNADATIEINGSKNRLEAIIGRPVTSFCYPYGDYRPTTVGLVKAAGFKYARTVARYRIVHGASLEAGTSVHAYRHLPDLPRLILVAGFNPVKAWKMWRDWSELAITLFDRAVATGNDFHLWGHSWEIDANHDWPRLERTLAHIASTKHFRAVTNGGMS